MRRRTAVIAGLALGGLMLVAAGQTWVEATGLGGGVVASAQATGASAAPVATAMALVVMTAALALTTARRVGVILVGGLMAAAGSVGAASAVTAALDPARTASAAVSTLTGTTAAAGAYAVTLWPWLCASGGALALGLGVAAILSRRAWGSTRRYDAPVAAVAGDPDGSGADRADIDGAGDAPLDEMDAWDELSRGNDPT